MSYIFDLTARATKVPSVLLLLLAGIALNQAARYWDSHLLVPPAVLQLFGIVGLILIVLEGSLDLRITRDKDTFQHGGISLEECIIPYVTLTAKG